MSNPIQQDGCIISPRRPNNNGYAGHRKLYEQAYGKLPRGIDVDHTCGNRRCINVQHMKPATRAENMENARKPRPKMSDEKVREIRKALAAGHLTQYEIAERFQTNGSTVTKIKTGRCYAGIGLIEEF